MARTLLQKLWDSHVVCAPEGQPAVLYIDLHLIHEVTSPQAFEGLRLSGRGVRRPDLSAATMDHNVPTTDRNPASADSVGRRQMEALSANCASNGILLQDLSAADQGIVHIIGPELGWTRPGMTIVCGDSHTATHGAFGSLAFGIGTSEVEHVLATQCLRQTAPQSMEIRVEGSLPPAVTAKDLILAIIGQIGTDGATGCAVEYTGEAIRGLSMEGRMTVCNMTIEAGARAGMVAPDETTFEYLRGRRGIPEGAGWDEAVTAWRALASDPGATYDRTVVVDASTLEPYVTWGTSPGQVVPIGGRVPDPDALTDESARAAARRSLAYMDLTPGAQIAGTPVSHVFIGSCTNGRIEDLREAARVARGRRCSADVRAIVVPGSAAVRRQAQDEGLDRVFLDAGFEWREPGCSMCLAMNADVLQAGDRCASTSNRNFEGRQGRGARTHLVSPAMAAAAALTGCLTDVRNLDR